MLILIHAGGYGRRLAPLTDYTPKPLLPIGNKALLDWIIEKLPPSPIFLSTNRHFEKKFIKWGKDKGVRVFVEESFCEEDKPGAVGGLHIFIKENKIHEGILLINGDNLFDFSLKDFKEEDKIVNFVFEIMDPERIKGRLGNVMMKNGRIIKFVEKPKEPISPYISLGIYFFPPQIFPLIEEFLTSSLTDRDNLGSFLSWLIEKKNKPVIGKLVKGKWIDIGSRHSFLEAYRIFVGRSTFVDERAEVLNSTLYHSVILGKSRIVNSELKGCIVDSANLENVRIENAIVGKGSDLRVK